MLWITLVLFIVGEAVTQVTFDGSCPDLEPFPNFVLAWAMGKWYETRRSDDTTTPGDKCLTADFTLVKNGSFLIKNSRYSSITGKTSSIDGIANPIGNRDDVKFRIIFPSPWSVETYYILDTDYDNWIIFWICRSAEMSSVGKAWILTRKRNPAASVIKKAYEALDRSKISRSNFVKSDQSNCPESY